MNVYKIVNITNQKNKRDFNYNKEITFDYVDNMAKKIIKIKSGETVYLKISLLPISLRKLRAKNLVTVSEISEEEMIKVMGEQKPKAVMETKKIPPTKKKEDSVKVSEVDTQKEFDDKNVMHSTKKKQSKKEPHQEFPEN